MAGEGVQHVALRIGRKQKLLIVLSVDIGQPGREILQQRHRHRAAADEGARLAAGQNLALDEQLAILDLEAGGLQQPADGGLVADVEDAGHARAGFAGADHVGRGAAAQQQAEGIHHDGFAAAGFAGQQIEPGVEADAQALDHGVVFDHQLQQH